MTKATTVTYSEARRLLKTGKLLANHSHGDIEMKQPKRKEDTPEFQQFSDLAKKAISKSAAMRTYKLAKVSLWRWVQAGIIREMGRGEDRRVVMLNEQDVAYCAYIQSQRGGQGHWLFNSNGTPYVPKADALEGVSA